MPVYCLLYWCWRTYQRFVGKCSSVSTVYTSKSSILKVRFWKVRVINLYEKGPKKVDNYANLDGYKVFTIKPDRQCPVNE